MLGFRERTRYSDAIRAACGADRLGERTRGHNNFSVRSGRCGPENEEFQTVLVPDLVHAINNSRLDSGAEGAILSIERRKGRGKRGPREEKERDGREGSAGQTCFFFLSLENMVIFPFFGKKSFFLGAPPPFTI